MKLQNSVVIGACLGAILATVGLHLPSALASRNSSGTYTLPAGNPVVTGTTISSSTHNSTMSDVATELTDSLSRSGKGAMTAALELADGTVAAPGLSFDTDTDVGLYRIGANNPGFSVNGVLTQAWSTTTSTFPRGVTVTQSQADTGAVVATANGTATAVTGTGGSTSGAGASFTGGAPNGQGLGVTGDGTGTGTISIGGDSSGIGVRGIGGATNGIGVRGEGAGSGAGASFVGGSTDGIGSVNAGTGVGVGATFANGTAASGGTRQDAATLTNGDLNLSGVTDATSTTSISDRLTPTNIVKAWGNIQTAGTHTILDAFNTTSVDNDASGLCIAVTIGSDLANNDYAVVISARDSFLTYYTEDNAVGSFDVCATRLTAFPDTWTQIDLNAQTVEVSYVVLGRQ